MKQPLAPLAITGIILAGLVQPAEAKKVDYEINGQRYSYESTNRQQVELARKRIEAANAAQLAQAKADARRASDPFAAIFGSQADREAQQAQADLKRLLAQQDEVAPGGTRRPTAQSVTAGRQGTAAARKETEAGEGQDVDRTARSTGSNRAAGETTKSTPVVAAKLRSVSFDLDSGIKTTVMDDGSLHEEPFDPGALSRFISETAGSRENVQVDRAEVTGSTKPVGGN